MFNPRTMECDHPSKVKCRPFEGTLTYGRQNQPVANRQQQQYSQRQEFAPIQCESGASGLFAHPMDCTKFLNCDHGRTFIQECGPGTAFNDVFKVCDWPHKVNCGTRSIGGNTNTNNYEEGSEGFNGEGVMDVRFGEPVASESRAHSVPHHDSRYEQNHNHIQNQNHNHNQHQHQNQHQYPYSNTPTVQMPEPSVFSRPTVQQQNSYQHAYPTRFPPRFPTPAPAPSTYQSNDGINSLSHSFPSSIDADVNAYPSPSFPSQNTIQSSNIDPKLEALDQTQLESSPKTQFIKVPDQVLLPPFKDSTVNSNDRTGRVDQHELPSNPPLAAWPDSQIETNFDTKPLIRPSDLSNVNNAHFTPTPTPKTYSYTTPQNTPPTQQFPELNYMSSRVANDFNKYFANPQSKVTPKVPPPPPSTTESQRRSTAPTKVYSIYPSGFETIGSQCEEHGMGLSEHPYDCSRYVSCENGRIRVQSCDPGFMFNPTLKICDFAYKCKSESSDSNQSAQKPLSEFPEYVDDLNEIHDDENNKKYEPTTPTTFDFSHTTPATNGNKNPYYIPDMSVLPLENENYPQNTYPELPKEPERPKWTYTGPKPSRGGDIPNEDLDLRFGLDESPSVTERIGKNLNHHIPTTTEQSRNVMRIPKGKEHIMPIYNRPTRPTATTSTTPKSHPTLQSYNQIYYQPFTKPFNQTQEKDETDYIPISEALKYLLRPYVTRTNDTKPMNDSQMNKIEDKLLDMIDNGGNQHKAAKPLEQDSLAAALLNDNNISVRNLPDAPKITGRSDVQTGSSFKTTPTTTEKYDAQNQAPASYFQPNNYHPSSSHINTDYYSPASTFNQPQYYKPGTNEPVKITFPGPHSQSHPMHGFNHQNPSTSASFHNTPPQTNHYHNGHHPHFGPNYHSNAGQFNSNNREIEPTTPITASAPLPNALDTVDKPTTPVRFAKAQYAEVSSCHEQFDCGTGFCISFSQVS